MVREAAYATLQCLFSSTENSNQRIISQMNPLQLAMTSQLSPVLTEHKLDQSCVRFVQTAHAWTMPRNHFAETDSNKVCTEMAKCLRADKFACLTIMQYQMTHQDTGKTENTTNHRAIHKHASELLAEEKKKPHAQKRHQAIRDASLLRIFLLGVANDQSRAESGP